MGGILGEKYYYYIDFLIYYNGRKVAMDNKLYLISIFPYLLLTSLLPMVAMAKCPGVDSYQPVKTAQPTYPKRAQKRGIEGYAIVSYTITTEGGIKDIKISESDPKGIFDRSVIKTIGKFHYEPCIVDGEAIELLDNELKFAFVLAE